MASILRDRIERGIMSRAIVLGDRLPGAREISAEYKVDQRVVAAAYRELADEGWVEIRQRSGVYAAMRNIALNSDRHVPAELLSQTLRAAVSAGYRTRDFADFLQGVASGRRLRAGVVADTRDQCEGIAHELGEYFDLPADWVLTAEIENSRTPPRTIARANILITTGSVSSKVSSLGRKLGKRVIVISMREGIIGSDGIALLQRPLYVVACDQQFITLLKGFVAGISGAENVRMILVDSPAVLEIPRGAPTYITQAARKVLGKTRLPGRLMETPRVFGADCAAEILDAMITANTSH